MHLAAQVRRQVSLDGQLLVAWRVLYHKTLFVCQVQQTDEAITRRDVRHCLLRVLRLEPVQDICELQLCVVVC